MSDTTRFDPRFDARFQRGFDETATTATDGSARPGSAAADDAWTTDDAAARLLFGPAGSADAAAAESAPPLQRTASVATTAPANVRTVPVASTAATARARVLTSAEPVRTAPAFAPQPSAAPTRTPFAELVEAGPTDPSAAEPSDAEPSAVDASTPVPLLTLRDVPAATRRWLWLVFAIALAAIVIGVAVYWNTTATMDAFFGNQTTESATTRMIVSALAPPLVQVGAILLVAVLLAWALTSPKRTRRAREAREGDA